MVRRKFGSGLAQESVEIMNPVSCKQCNSLTAFVVRIWDEL